MILVTPENGGEYVGNREDAILLASYNGEKYTAEQIESLLAQTEAEWELFVHDDGSADRTLEVLRCYEAWYPDRIHVLDGLPCGGAKNNFLRMMRIVRMHPFANPLKSPRNTRILI